MIAMRALGKSLAGLLGAGAMILIAALNATAYPDYAAGCINCHGDFNSGTYVSLVDGQNWGTDLMSGHKDTIIDGANDCGICHTSPGRSPVFLNSSDGGRGLATISCLGCHGRDEGSGPSGAGLRQHHFRNGVTVCGNSGCHPNDADPANFTTAGESVLPPYYANPGTDHPNIPDDPCNPGPGYPEDIFGAMGTGLDNDGNDAYDENDTDCVATGIEPILSYNLELQQNYPNPFNPQTWIRFTVETGTAVQLDVISPEGRLVRSLLSGEIGPGSYEIPWDGRDRDGNPASSGVYFYRLRAGKEQSTRKMVLLK